MTPGSAAERLAGMALSLHPSDDVRGERLQRVREYLFSRSRELREANFRHIQTRDLELLFEAYDREFFEGCCRAALAGRRLDFRLSPRMTKAAGHTRRLRFRTGETAFEIAIAASMLFDGFGPEDRRIAVCGLDCPTRLDALERVFEHELVHLVENLCWEASSCSAERFQGIARRVFGHRSHTHDLITRRERAAGIGIRPGMRVAFVFEGRRLAGRVNRITQRATVLVEDPAGEPYSDGRRYQRFYVPLRHLELEG